MPTQCRPVSFGFQGCQGRKVTAAFDGGSMTSNGGALLLRAADRSIGLVDRVTACFTDQATELGPYAGGAADHGHCPTRGSQRPRSCGTTRCWRCFPGSEGCRIGQEPLNRLEHAPPAGAPGRYHRIEHDADALQAVLLESFIDAWKGRRPSRLVLDIDSTDDEVHGRQEGGFYHGYYNHYCFLPLYITCGRRPLFALLRPGNADPAGGVRGPLGRIVERLRQRWPGLKILLRADSAYAREEILAWCEDSGVDYVIGLARNSRLVEKIGRELADAAASAGRRGRSARRFTEFLYATLTSWSRKRRVVAKAEHLPGKSNPRFVVTSLPDTFSARTVYERVYCPRGNENAIRSWISSPTEPRRRASPSSGSSSPPSPRSSSTPCAVAPGPAWPAPPPEPSGAPQDRRPRDRLHPGSRSRWTPIGLRFRGPRTIARVVPTRTSSRQARRGAPREQ